MNKERGAVFRQSVSEFPCLVELGKCAPSFGLHRFKNGLRFIPVDDEGFTLRGDKKRLVYKGRRQSHRFTILGNTAFEYDCILLREPESNVIALHMEGAENFDFFRQPDFVSDNFLKGSYAVYKKETLVGEGTGKLCHIHRPEIIDARGRRCWGELTVVGDELHITIPDWFLSNAKYPVVVDPTIGTTTVGSQTHWDNVENESYDQLFIEAALAVNRFLIPENFYGTATAYVYAYERDSDYRCKPVLYSDNNNVPLTRRSTNEGTFNIDVVAGNPAGWRSTSFNTNTSIASGSYLWFGLFCDWFAPKFDYGAKCYWDTWEFVGNDIPNTYPVWSSSWYFNFKLSMYFTYISAQNYVRTLTQGVNLSDSKNIKANYKRIKVDVVNGLTKANSIISFFRNCFMTVLNNSGLSRKPVFYRSALEQIEVSELFENKRDISRKCFDSAEITSDVNRSKGFLRLLCENIELNDDYYFPILFLRSIPDVIKISDIFRNGNEYIRELFDEAKNIAETIRQSDYKRFNSENVHAEGSVFRQFFIFVKILTVSFIRDFIINRFLIAKEEIVLRSRITREILLESKIN